MDRKGGSRKRQVIRRKEIRRGAEGKEKQVKVGKWGEEVRQARRR